MMILLQLTIVLVSALLVWSIFQRQFASLLGAASNDAIELVEVEVVSDAEMHQHRFARQARRGYRAHRRLTAAGSSNASTAHSALARAKWERSLEVLRA